MKRGKLDISWKLWSLLVGFFVLIGAISVSYAYGSSSPSVMGHSLSEIGIPACSEGQSLSYDSQGNLACSSSSFGSKMDRVIATTYLAESDGFLVVFPKKVTNECISYYSIFSDNSEDPTTLVGYGQVYYQYASASSTSVPIKAGNYYKVLVTYGSESCVSSYFYSI